MSSTGRLVTNFCPQCEDWGRQADAAEARLCETEMAWVQAVEVANENVQRNVERAERAEESLAQWRHRASDCSVALNQQTDRAEAAEAKVARLEAFVAEVRIAQRADADGLDECAWNWIDAALIAIDAALIALDAGEGTGCPGK